MAYIRVVPEFKTSSTRIKPLFAYASFIRVCIGNSGLLILTSHNDTCKFEMFWSSLAIFLQKTNPLFAIQQEQPLFVDKRLINLVGYSLNFMFYFLIR
jgi:hypothetical protein